MTTFSVLIGGAPVAPSPLTLLPQRTELNAIGRSVASKSVFQHPRTPLPRDSSSIVALAATATMLCSRSRRQSSYWRHRLQKTMRQGFKRTDFMSDLHVAETGHHFEVFRDQVLGSGAQGTVYRGRDMETKGDVAIKVIPTWRLMLEDDAEEKVADIEQEFGTLRKMGDHPNIACLISSLDVFPEAAEGVKPSIPRYKIIIMEVVNGCELAEHVAAGGPMIESIARHVFLQIIDALDHMHKQGIVHRDLKPENVMVTGEEVTLDSEVKLIDFGVAKCISNGPLKTVVGTPAIMAPEVARARVFSTPSAQVASFEFGEAYEPTSAPQAAPATFAWGAAEKAAAGGTVTTMEPARTEFCPKIDVWSAGIVLYTCLTGKLPFKCEQEIMNADYKEEPLSHISQEARDIVRAMLEKDPDKRLSLAECHDHPWVGCSEDDGCTIDWDNMSNMMEEA